MLVVMNKGTDKLGAFINANRSSFDDLKAPRGLWDQIEPELDPEPKGYWKWAVGIVGIIIVVAGAYMMGQQSISQDAPDNEIQQFLNLQDEALEYANLPDFKETRQYFDMQIVQVYNEVKRKNSDATLLEDISQLDVIEKELIQELEEAEGVYKEHVLQAMIRNQQTKLNLLLDVLDQINQSEQQKKNIYEDL